MENKTENEKKDAESTHRLEEIIERFCGKRENIDSLKRKNNLFIDKDMVSIK
ncbi:hypothetical protein M1139_02270 [Candidatus Parvarchaeota archaeon]|nr:hypothetical protein [Candidatus Parvarchaeota archaeon]